MEQWLAGATGRFVASDWFDGIARLGYASKAAVFGVVGGLAMARAVGAVRGAEDTPGALESLEGVPGHQALLAVLALGLLGYALWRFAQALLDAEGDGLGWKGATKRVVYLVIGVFYGYLAVFAAAVMLGHQRENDGVRDFTATVLGWPGGTTLVAVVGLGVMAGGAHEVFFALSGRFRHEFERREMAGWERGLMKGAGWWGHAGRGVVYGLLGVLIIKAAVTFDADEAAGLAQGFRTIEALPFGGVLLGLAGAAFLAFGAYCALLAVHREIDNEGAVHGSLEEV